MINGVLSINKPSGITSYDVIRVIKRRFGLKKIGHCGTLDPLARGVLLVCLGKATKLFECLSSEQKVYETEMILGYETDTGDTDGSVIRRMESASSGIPSSEQIREVLSSYAGQIEQIPPMYSAVKHKGRKLYEFAREGITVERKKRKVHIYSIQLNRYACPLVTFTVECSRGTYVRTLVTDIGEKLGTYATVSSLIRKRVGVFTIEDSISYNTLENLTFEELAEVAKKYTGLALGERNDSNYRFF